MAIDSKYGYIAVPDIPKDEPIFIIRAKDKSAPQAIEQYANTAIVNGSPSEHGAACRLVAANIRRWQNDHVEVVKAGD